MNNAQSTSQKVVAWARPVYARPVNTPDTGEWDELVDIEFHTRPEKPGGGGWYPLAVCCDDPRAAERDAMLAERDARLRDALAETAWQRGFQQGLDANRLSATQAMDALKKEREAHAETNRAMTEALLGMEEREQRDAALLRQALDTLAYWLEHGETPGAHDMIQRTHDALQERLK